MFRFGLIGYPLSHSMSPAIHEQALVTLGLTGRYDLFEIQPGKSAQPHFLEILQQMRSGQIHGLNVTIPYKHQIMSFVDTFTAEASRIGAVNTLYFTGNDIVGTNTDAPAFAQELATAGVTTKGNALILGAGGAAYAVAYTLLASGWNLIVATRRIAQALNLQRWFAGQDSRYHIQAITLSQRDLEPFQSSVTLVVNTTPVGMTPHIDSNPWPDELPLPRSAFVYDLIYNPSTTMLLKIAVLNELPHRGGAGMLVEQAALAFELWTGKEAPRITMAETLNRLLVPTK